MASLSETQETEILFKEDEEVSDQTEESDITKNNDDDEQQRDVEDAESSTDEPVDDLKEDPIDDPVDDPMEEDQVPECEGETGFHHDTDNMEVTGNMWPAQWPEKLGDYWWSFEVEKEILEGEIRIPYIDPQLLNLRLYEQNLEVDWEYQIWNFNAPNCGAPMA